MWIYKIIFNPSFQVTRAIVDQFSKVSKGDVSKEEIERAK